MADGLVGYVVGSTLRTNLASHNGDIRNIIFWWHQQIMCKSFWWRTNNKSLSYGREDGENDLWELSFLKEKLTKLLTMFRSKLMFVELFMPHEKCSWFKPGKIPYRYITLQQPIFHMKERWMLMLAEQAERRKLPRMSNEEYSSSNANPKWNLFF